MCKFKSFKQIHKSTIGQSNNRKEIKKKIKNLNEEVAQVLVGVGKKREGEGWEEFHRRIENKIVEPSSKQGIQRSTLQQSPQILDPS